MFLYFQISYMNAHGHNITLADGLLQTFGENDGSARFLFDSDHFFTDEHERATFHVQFMSSHWTPQLGESIGACMSTSRGRITATDMIFIVQFLLFDYIFSRSDRINLNLLYMPNS